MNFIEESYQNIIKKNQRSYILDIKSCFVFLICFLSLNSFIIYKTNLYFALSFFIISFLALKCILTPFNLKHQYTYLLLSLRKNETLKNLKEWIIENNIEEIITNDPYLINLWTKKEFSESQKPEQKKIFLLKNDYKVFNKPQYSELRQFIDKHIGSGKQVHKFFYEQIEVHRKEYNASLLSWALHLPLAKLNDNQKLEIIKTCKVYRLEHFINQQKEINDIFKNYQAKDIIRLFQGVYSGMNYCHYIKIYTHNFKMPLPVFKSMNKLIEYIKVYIEECETDYEEQFYFDLNTPLGKASFIKNFYELYQCSQRMRNCASDYMFDPKYQFYFIEDRNIMFHLNFDGRIIEVKNRLNQQLKDEEETLLQNHIKKTLRPKEFLSK